jgi:hypothetical protein
MSHRRSRTPTHSVSFEKPHLASKVARCLTSLRNAINLFGEPNSEIYGGGNSDVRVDFRSVASRTPLRSVMEKFT